MGGAVGATPTSASRDWNLCCEFSWCDGSETMRLSAKASGITWWKCAAILEIVAVLAAANMALWKVEATLHFVDVGAVLRSAAKKDASIKGSYVALVLLLHLTLRAASFLL